MKIKETIKNISTEDLIPFRNHPFKSRSGAEQEELKSSISTQGTIEPLIVRPFSSSEGKYEVISGHRRLEICKELGVADVPVIVRNMTDEEAVIMMVDSNIQRESLLPSEKAFAYKMKLEALSHQGKTTLDQVGPKWTTKEIGKENNDSMSQVKRYVRLTYLIPELLKMVDEQRIAFTPAVGLSYLPEREQRVLLDEIEYTDATPSLSQAQRLRKFSSQGRLSVDTVFAVLSEEKPNQKEQVKFMTEDIRKYFPKNYSNKDMQETILKLLENWQRKRERNAREER